MHLDSTNSETIDSMSRESIQTGWIHHLAHNFTNVANNAAAATALATNAAAATAAGTYHPAAGAVTAAGLPALPPSVTNPGHHAAASLKFPGPTPDHGSPTGLKLHSDHSPIDQQQQNNHHSQFTELRTAAAAQTAQAVASSVDHAAAATAWPASMPHSYLAVAAASHNQAANMMHPVVSARNSFTGASGATHPNAAWPHPRNSYPTTTQFASAEQVAAAYRTGCNLNIMNAVVAGGAADHHSHNSTAAAAAAAMHAMPFYMTAPPNPMAPGAHPAVVHHQNPFVSPHHHPYAAQVAAAEMYSDHTSSTFRYNPTTGKTRTKDKYRVVYTDRQRAELENEFRSAQYITIRRKSELAMQVGLSERQVKIWFQNRRAKERKVSRKVPGGGNHSSSDVEDSDNEIEEEDEENNLRSPSKHQSLTSPGTNNTTCHNGVVQLPLIKGEPNRIRSPTNDLYGVKLS